MPKNMKQCPNCGKYVAADRTYCMNCGFTLGVRCPSCQAVVDVGSKVCPQCGHSFVEKKKLEIPLWDFMKQHAKPILGILILAVTLFSFIAAAFPGVAFSVRNRADQVVDTYGASLYSLLGYFIGFHPDSVERMLELRAFKQELGAFRALLYGEGAGMLLLLLGLLCAVLLLLPNYKRMSRVTAGRMFAPLGVAFGGSLMAFVCSLLIARKTAVAPGAPLAGLPVPPALYVWPLVLCIVLTVLFAVQVLLYAGVLRKQEAAGEEWPLHRLLAFPFSAAVCGVRKLCRRFGKQKGTDAPRRNRDEGVLTVTKRFTPYIILLCAALVFTQALLSKVSNIFFWFLFFLPPVLLVYTLLSRPSLSVTMLCDSATVEKNTPYTYEFHIENHSPLAFPFIEALVSLPQSNSVRCTERRVRVSMAPFSRYCLKNTVSFRFRGTYEIGVQGFYVYDFFRVFCTYIPIENVSTVYVMPRRLTLDETLAQAISDSTARTVRSPLVVDRLEVSDIRDYRTGDPLKSIHWKLSSKAEEFIVKDYNTGTANQTVIFCDLAAHFPDEPPRTGADSPAPGAGGADTPASSGKKRTRAEKRAEKRAAQDAQQKNSRIREDVNTHAISEEALEERLEQRREIADERTAGDPVNNAGREGTNPLTDAVGTISSAADGGAGHDVHRLARPAYYEDMNEYLADGVVELTIATVLSELRQGHEVLLTWFDRRSESGLFAYPLRGEYEFENIYHLFATAPLCAEEHTVTSLTAMVNDTESAKLLFVIPSLDEKTLEHFCDLPISADAGSQGAAEVILYNPEERFAYPRERAAYMAGCREELRANGLSLVMGGSYLTAEERSEQTPDGARAEADAAQANPQGRSSAAMTQGGAACEA